MSEGTWWSTDLGAPLHIDTDANPDLWGYLHLQIDKKTFKEWLDLHLTALATIHGIELTRKHRRYHKSFYEQTIVTLRDKVQANEAFIYHPVPLTYMPLVMHATRLHCDARDASACEGITAATVPHPEIPEWQQRTGSIPFASPHLGEDGVRVTRSYPADSTINKDHDSAPTATSCASAGSCRSSPFASLVCILIWWRRIRRPDRDRVTNSSESPDSRVSNSRDVRSNAMCRPRHRTTRPSALPADPTALRTT
ncbi:MULTISPECIES: hypothetical protein [Streptomyces]|uniref:hypothetical protein n=1 Tax=Streptomyces TaxID=1883 RepID=UPI003460E694